jgi:hypothetical protein
MAFRQGAFSQGPYGHPQDGRGPYSQLYGSGSNPNPISARQNTIEQLTMFLGPPAPHKAGPGESFSFDHLQMPSAFTGERQMWAEMFVRTVTAEEMVPVTRLLPWKRKEDGLTESWRIYKFHNHLAGRVPEEGASRMVSEELESGSKSMVRYGMAIEVERGFWKTEMGRQEYAAKRQQVANAIIETSCLDVMVEIMGASPVFDNFHEARGDFSMASIDQILQEEAELYCIAQKSPEGVKIVHDRIKQIYTRRGLSTDFIFVIPEGLKKYVDNNPIDKLPIYNKNASLQGTDVFQQLGISGIWESRGFYVNANAPVQDPMWSPSYTGSFAYLPLGDIATISPADYRSHYETITLYDERLDDFVDIGPLRRISECGLFSKMSPGESEDPDSGTLSTYGRHWFGAGNSTWGSYLRAADPQHLTTLVKHLSHESIHKQTMSAFYTTFAPSVPYLSNISRAIAGSAPGLEALFEKKKAGDDIGVAEDGDEDEFGRSVDLSGSSSRSRRRRRSESDLRPFRSGLRGSDGDLRLSSSGLPGTFYMDEEPEEEIPVDESSSALDVPDDERMILSAYSSAIQALPTAPDAVIAAAATIAIKAFRKGVAIGQILLEFSTQDDNRNIIEVESLQSAANNGKAAAAVDRFGQIGDLTAIVSDNGQTIMSAASKVLEALNDGSRVSGPLATMLANQTPAERAREVLAILDPESLGISRAQREAYINYVTRFPAIFVNVDKSWFESNSAAIMIAVLRYVGGNELDGRNVNKSEAVAAWLYLMARLNSCTMKLPKNINQSGGTLSGRVSAVTGVTAYDTREFVRLLTNTDILQALQTLNRDGISLNLGKHVKPLVDRLCASRTELMNALHPDTSVSDLFRMAYRLERNFVQGNGRRRVPDRVYQAAKANAVVPKTQSIRDVLENMPISAKFPLWCIQNDVPTPITSLFLRPFIGHETGTALGVKPDGQTGYCYYGFPNAMASDDNGRKTYSVHVTWYASAAVRRADRVVRVFDVMSRAYLGGNSTATYPWDERGVNAYLSLSPFKRPIYSMFNVPVPASWKPDRWWLSITGEIENFGAGTPDQGARHFPNAHLFAKAFKLRADARPTTLRGYQSKRPQVNRYCLRGYQATYSPHTLQKTNVVVPKDHLGPNIYPGFASVMRGMNMYVQNANIAGNAVVQLVRS